jgi:hypothetical protein
LYDQNDGNEILEALDSLPHNMILIAPSASSYINTTSKTVMKREFVKADVPTAPFTSTLLTNPESFRETTWFVKMDEGAGSVGIFADNKVTNVEDMKRVWERMESLGYGVFAEHFISGREFSVLVAGSADSPVVFPIVERSFVSGIEGHQQHENWDNFSFRLVSRENNTLIREVEELAVSAYRAIDPAPYARIDIRDRMVLEVNTVPGYAFLDTHYSMGAILDQDTKQFKRFWDTVWATRRTQLSTARAETPSGSETERECLDGLSGDEKHASLLGGLSIEDLAEA